LISRVAADFQRAGRRRRTIRFSTNFVPLKIPVRAAKIKGATAILAKNAKKNQVSRQRKRQPRPRNAADNASASTRQDVANPQPPVSAPQRLTAFSKICFFFSKKTTIFPLPRLLN